MGDKSCGEGGCPVRFAPLQVSLHRLHRSRSRTGACSVACDIGQVGSEYVIG
jgi:hypothetical protein